MQTSKEYGTEHDGVAPGGARQHLSPSEVTHTGETHAESLGVSAQLCVQCLRHHASRFNDGGSVTIDIEQIEGRGGLIDVGQQLMEEAHMFFGRDPETCFGNEVAEGLSGRQRLASSLEDGAHFRIE